MDFTVNPLFSHAMGLDTDKSGIEVSAIANAHIIKFFDQHLK
jgi:hypothetical protein